MINWSLGPRISAGPARLLILSLEAQLIRLQSPGLRLAFFNRHCLLSWRQSSQRQPSPPPEFAVPLSFPEVQRQRDPPAAQEGRRPRLDPWVGKEPLEKEMAPRCTYSYLRKSHGRRSLLSPCPWGCDGSCTTELSMPVPSHSLAGIFSS